MVKVIGSRELNRRSQPCTIIIARGDSIRHFTVRPWLALFSGTLVATLATSYVLATSYLVFRDDLITGSVTREARLHRQYDDELARLRSQLDHATSHRVLDQDVLESKVRALVARQE